jgi:phospholipid/cholesterol/gamma-HCH transport system substrate-binding protein
MPRESNLELKVGLFVIVAIVSLSCFILSVGDFAQFQKGDRYRIVFNNANGVKKSAPVRVAGVETGLVQEVSLFFDEKESKTKVQIYIWVKKGTKIPSDSQIMVNQLGLFGEKYIEILPGSDWKQLFSVEATITGVDPIIQEEISKKIMQVADKVEQGIAGLDAIITDPENRDSFKLTLKQLGLLTSNLEQILAHIQSGQGTVGKFLYDSAMYNDLQDLTADLKANPWKLLYRPKAEKSKR